MYDQLKSGLKRYFFILPIIYLFVAIFPLRGSVKSVYLAAGILTALTFIASALTKNKPDLGLARWLVTLGAIGLSAAVILSIEKVELLIEPNHVTSCSLSPVVACSPIIASPQASAFGFPNPFIGIFGFSALLTAGMTIAAGATKLSRVWWRTLLAGITFGVGFSIWLIHEGVFEIGKLCLYCMLVWLVSFSLFWLVLNYMVTNRHINLGSRLNKLAGYKVELIATTYVIVFLIIFTRWSDYWLSLL